MIKIGPMKDKKLEDRITEIIQERSRLIIQASHYNQLDDKTFELHGRNMAKAILAEVKDKNRAI